MTTALKQLTCLRCGYQWWPRALKKPDRCAKCNSPYWNKPRGAKQGRPKKHKRLTTTQKGEKVK